MSDLLSPDAVAFGQSAAFPAPTGSQGGITIRDWLAGQAFQGLAVNGLEIKADRHMTQEERNILLAERAYDMADSMLIVRTKENQPA